MEDLALSSTVAASEGPFDTSGAFLGVKDHDRHLDQQGLLVVRVISSEATNGIDDFVVIERDDSPSSGIGTMLDSLRGPVGETICDSHGVDGPSRTDLHLFYGVCGVDHGAHV